MTTHDNPNLDDVGDELDTLITSEGAALKYDMLSDALYWSDELPASALDDPERFSCMQQVLRYRMTLILDTPDQDLASVWDHAKQRFPNWPGFAEDRCRPNAELVRQYHDYHERAINSFRSIPD